MPQGQLKAKKAPKKRAKPYSCKKQSTQFTKKGNPKHHLSKRGFVPTSKGEKKLSGVIHRNIEEVAAAKAVQGGSRLLGSELGRLGKEKAKEIRRMALKKKKSRAEEKVESMRKKLEAEKDD